MHRLTTRPATMRRHLTILFATATILLVGGGIATAGGGGHGGGACDGFADGQELVMRDSCFEGTGHVVTAGRTITVVNSGDLPHTVTAADGSFDSGTIQPGETWELTVEDTGNVPIYCTLHGTSEGAGMAGLLAVQAAGGLEGAEPVSSPAAGSTGPWLVALVLGVLLCGVLAVAVRSRRSTTPLRGGATSR